MQLHSSQNFRFANSSVADDLKSCAPIVPGSKVYLLYRDNHVYQHFIGSIQKLLHLVGWDINVYPYPVGSRRDFIHEDSRLFLTETSESREALFLFDDTLRVSLGLNKALQNGAAIIDNKRQQVYAGSLSQIFDDATLDALKAIPEIEDELCPKISLVGSNRFADFERRLGVCCACLTYLFKEALKHEVPEEILLLPSKLMQHRPLCLIYDFVFKALKQHPKFESLGIDANIFEMMVRDANGCLCLNEHSLFNSSCLGHKLRSLIKELLGFDVKEPVEILRDSLIAAGYPGECIHNLKDESAMQNFPWRRNIWVIGARHALTEPLLCSSLLKLSSNSDRTFRESFYYYADLKFIHGANARIIRFPVDSTISDLMDLAIVDPQALTTRLQSLVVKKLKGAELLLHSSS